ncbi:MAG: PAS domain S-box protein [bacterium]
MGNKKYKSEAEILRLKAEELLKNKPSRENTSLIVTDTLKLVHDLDIFQIELESQFEELSHAQAQSEAAANKYSILFNSAPTNYISLSREGTIIDLNPHAARLIGKEQQKLVKSQFGFFITDDTKPIYNRFLATVFKNQSEESCEVDLITYGNVLVNADLNGIATDNGEQCLVTIFDITKRKTIEKALSLSENRYRKAQEVGHVGSWEYDIKNDTFWGSDESKRIYGFNVESDLFSAEEVMKCVVEGDIVNQAMVDLIGKNKSYNIVFDIIPLNSRETRTINSIAELNRDIAGNPIRVTGVLIDITERRREEIRIEESEEKFRTIAEQSFDFISLTDENGIITYASSTSISLFLVTPDEMCGRNFMEFVHEPSIPGAIEMFQNIVRDNKGFKRMEVIMKRKDGSLFDGEINGSPYNTSFNNGTLVTIHDISERKHAEKALIESERFYRNFVETSLDGVYKSTHDGKFVEVNPAMVNMLGYETKEDLMSIDIKTQLYFEPTDRESLMPQELLEETGVYRMKKKDGSEIWVEDHAWYDFDENGGILYHEGILRDVTVRKYAEDEIRLLNETLEYRIAERTRQLETINKQLEFHMGELEQFAYVSNHDLQEPIRALVQFSQLIKDDYAGKLDEDGNKYIEFIMKAALRMKELVKDLFEYSILGKESKTSAIDCNNIVYNVIDDLDVPIKKSNARITVQELPTINGYETELRLLFQNLIANAIKYQKQGNIPEINISAESRTNEWLFEISDNGIGIDKNSQKKIFIIFQRLHNRNEYEGTGIGLAHCKKVVELHGGRIWVESRPGMGSRFKFTISKNASLRT